MPQFWHLTLSMSSYVSVFELLNVDFPVRLVVNPFEDLGRVWNRLVCLIRPHHSLEAFVEGNRPRSIPNALEAINKPQNVLEPIGRIVLVSGAIHEYIWKAVSVELVLFVCLQDPVAAKRTIKWHPNQALLISHVARQSEEHGHRDKIHVVRSLRWIVWQDGPVSRAHLAHPRVIYSEVALLDAIFDDCLPSVDIVPFTREHHAPISLNCWSHLNEAHIGIGLPEQSELLLHAADRMLDFLVARQLVVMCFCRDTLKL